MISPGTPESKPRSFSHQTIPKAVFDCLADYMWYRLSLPTDGSRDPKPIPNNALSPWSGHILPSAASF